MQLALTVQEQAFAEEVRAFVKDNLPADIAGKVGNDQTLLKDDYVRWQQILGRKGWLVNTWPERHGGPGWSVVQQYLFDAICSEMDCPPLIPFGPRMIGPVLLEYGTAEQQARFIPPIRDSTEWWCQGYSEPGAGSDLASLSVRAEDRADSYLVNGQKIWTSWAHYADWMFCLVRTSRQERPQQGITFLLIDMKTPGLEVRPIAMLDGTHSFNSVFLTDVVVPKENRIGEEGAGWTYAKFLLSHERLDNASVGLAKRLLKKLLRIASGEADMRGTPLANDAVFQSKLTDVQVRLIALELRVLQYLAAMARGDKPGAAVSALKIRGTELCQRILELTLEAAGYYGMPYQPELIHGADTQATVGPLFAATAAARYLNRRAMSIFGGTTEIQKNIMAKAVLGM